MTSLGTSSHRLAAALACAAAVAVAAACAKSDRRDTTDTAAGGLGGDSAASVTTAAGPSSSKLSLASIAGKWNVRATPETGDSTPTMSVLTATADTGGWTLTFPNRKPIRLHVVAVTGDSIVTESEPYESVRRKGVRVTTRGVYRLQGDKLVGETTARYQTPRADSVLRLRTEGTRVP